MGERLGGLSPLVSLLKGLVASLEGRLIAIWLNWMQIATEGLRRSWTTFMKLSLRPTDASALAGQYT